MGIITKPTVEAGNHETLCAMFSISLMFAMLLAKLVDFYLCSLALH
jgi:hypothetical protein